MTIYTNVIAFNENSYLYNNNGKDEFYYDKGLNIGFGLNVSLNTQATVEAAFAAAGLSFNQDQLNAIFTEAATPDATSGDATD